MPKAILIIIDGCRVDAIQQASTPNIDGLIAEGAHTFDAATVSPSITQPAHFSIFTSQDPISHNVLTNTGRPVCSPSATTLFEVAKTFQKFNAAVYSWENLRNLAPPGALDYAFYLNTYNHKYCDIDMAIAAADCLQRFRPDFCFLYLEGVDEAGHQHGWMSKAYLDALQTADNAVGILLEALALSGLDAVSNIILHSDHGGEDNHHKEPVSESLTIPWIAWGPNIRKGHTIAAPVSVLDTAPTAAHLLGIPAHYSWEGRPIDELFIPQTSPMTAEKAA
jgi:predicted AlkP superfamily pyrophosphatase or phosphodiesterase